MASQEVHDALQRHRRVHMPREKAIRLLMADNGIDLSLYGPSSMDNLQENPDVEISCGLEEDMESEQEAVDDPCTMYASQILNHPLLASNSHNVHSCTVKSDSYPCMLLDFLPLNLGMEVPIAALEELPVDPNVGVSVWMGIATYSNIQHDMDIVDILRFHRTPL